MPRFNFKNVHFRLEAMPDVIYMLEGLVAQSGEVLIPGFYNDVQPFTSEEGKLYKEVDFSVAAYKKQLGCETLYHNSKVGFCYNHVNMKKICLNSNNMSCIIYLTHSSF